MPNDSLPTRDAPVFRFAPSPNGHLHLGHAYSALLNQRLAQESGGRLLLRIEDIDVARCRPALVDDMLEDLEWLGLSFERPVRRQSEHFADYDAALDRLDAAGLIYASAASRAEIAEAATLEELRLGRVWPRDPDGAPLFPRRLIGQAAQPGGPHAMRLDMAKAIALARPLSFDEHGEGIVEAVPARWGDVVLRRKDVPTSYHIAVVVDDALQGVTDVVRGRDLYAATDLHRLLQVLLGLPEPRYRHHPLMLGMDGEKLAKSLASKSLRALRREGATPTDVRRWVELD